MPIISGGGAALPAGLSSGIVYQAGAGSPVDVVTPTQQGAVYQDKMNGGLYLAIGATNTGWLALGGVAGDIGSATGIVWIEPASDRDLWIMAGERNDAASVRSAYLGDAYSQWNGHQQGVEWLAGPGEGLEYLRVTTGSAGQYVGTLQDGNGLMTLAGALASKPAASSASALALGSAFQNVLGYDVLLVVYLSVTVNTSGVLKLGVGPTSTPTQQTLVTGITSTGLWTVPIYLPATYYALLSATGTITVAVDGQHAMPV